MATFYYNVHTPESRLIAQVYFKVGVWYHSSLSNILAKHVGEEGNIGFWMFGNGNQGTKDSVRMINIDEWKEATPEQVEKAENLLKFES